MKGFKVVREDHEHNGFKYQEGLNIDPKPFSVEGSCVEGGLYFFTNITDVFKWLGYGVYLYEVTVPEDYQYVLDPGGDKYRSSGLILSNPLDLREVDTWEYLISQGNSPNGLALALRWASEYGYLEVLKYLVKQGVDIHADNDCALPYAAENGHLDIVKYLVKKGADIHAGDDYALCWSARKGYLDLVKYLVKKGADIHAGDEYALRWAASYGHLEIVKLLVENGADIHAYEDYAFRGSARNGYLDIVKFLVSQGTDIHACNDEALRLAALNGHLEVVEYLKSVGANYEGV